MSMIVRLPKDKRMTEGRIAALVQTRDSTTYYLYLYIPEHQIKNDKVKCLEYMADGSTKNLELSVNYLVNHCLVHEAIHYAIVKLIDGFTSAKFDNIAPYVMESVMSGCT